MKRTNTLILFIFATILCFAQAPQSFRYQAVVRHLDGSIVQNQIVSLRISILPDSPLNNSVYSEWHRLATNEFGIVNIKVGEGTNIMGTFSAINWGAHSFFLKTELDILGNDNYIFIGTTELLSVPYALYAANAVNVDDADADPENEIQVLSFSNDTLYLQNGGWVYLGHYLDNTDQQTLSLSGTTLSISNGNTVVFNEAVDLDGDPTNELQFLSISNDTIYLTNGGYVKLPETFDGQYSSLIGAPTNVSHFNNDAGYLISPNDADADPTNELQIISIHGDTISLSNGGFVRLPTGQNPGDMRYWNGTSWKLIPGGQESQVLMWRNNKPQWCDIFHVGSMGPAGGTVFYDKGFYSDGWRYLEVAPFETEISNYTSQWGCSGTLISGADGPNIGDGEQNTTDIVSGCSEINIYARICFDLVYNGYDDWFLPSKEELVLLRNNLYLKGWGVLCVNYTWYHSSTEINETQYYSYNLGNGSFDWRMKFSTGSGATRAIRKF